MLLLYETELSDDQIEFHKVFWERVFKTLTLYATQQNSVYENVTT